MSTTNTSRKRQAILRFYLLSITLLVLLSLLSTGCYYSCEKYSYITYDAVYRDLDSLKATVGVVDPRSIGSPGALYYKEGYIFINERGEGIHIIDDRDPSDPQPVSFINIPGNYSLAAKGDFLYADNYTDMLVFDISDMANIRFLKREEGVFSDFSAVGVNFDEASNAIVEFIPTEHEDSDCGVNSVLSGQAKDGQPVVDVAQDLAGGDSETGEAGSMARFVIDGETLYTVDWSTLNVFDITSPGSPEKSGDVPLGWGIETIFPYEDMLFIGTMDGMYIMDNADPLHPVELSWYGHTRSCDPVVVQGDYAYVTLRSGTECQGFVNQLDIVNISDPTSPFLEKTYEMLNPHGLDINGSCLFVCEGDHGLKAFEVDLLNPTEITQTEFYQNVHAFDVISLPDILMMVGEDGFYQYSYNCGGRLLYLSQISFGSDR